MSSFREELVKQIGKTVSLVLTKANQGFIPLIILSVDEDWVEIQDRENYRIKIPFTSIVGLKEFEVSDSYR